MIAIDKYCRVITRVFPGILSFLAVFLLTVPARSQSLELPVSRLSGLTTDWALADFDGDSLPDLAIAELPASGGVYRIRLHLSGTDEARQFEFSFAERSSLTIRAQDVDGDHDLDLIITSGVSKKPVGVWLNEGDGNFSRSDPSLYNPSIWRGPPSLSSRTLVRELPLARPEHSRTGLLAAPTWQPELPASSQAEFPMRYSPSAALLPEQLRVRPPPAV